MYKQAILLFALLSLLPAFLGAAEAMPATSSETPSADPTAPPMKPGLKWTTIGEYEAQIGEAGVLVKNDYLLLFAPEKKTKEANIVFGYLARAYTELQAIVGQPTKYKLVVYHLPKGWGGTSECVIEYDYSNLDFENSDEWRKHHVPHVSGYIEEMAHNFVSGTKAQFGWEMIGWSLGVTAARKVANNPIFERHVRETRARQAQTWDRYRTSDLTFPPDLEANLCDRVHAHLLWQCERRYGPKFWKDFFAEIRNSRGDLDNAIHLAGDDNIRNERYRITVNCFDRLRGLGFKRLLEANHISTTVDAKSLHPTKAGWDRKFTPPESRERGHPENGT